MVSFVLSSVLALSNMVANRPTGVSRTLSLYLTPPQPDRALLQHCAYLVQRTYSRKRAISSVVLKVMGRSYMCKP